MSRGGGIGAGLVLVALAAGCGSETIVVQVPFEDGDRAAVIAVVTDRGPQLWAVDAALRDSQPVLQSVAGWTGTERVEVQVEYYLEPLEELGLRAGPLVSVEGGDALHRGRRVAVGALQNTGEVTWQTLGQRPLALSELRVAARTPCRVLTADTERFFLDVEEVPLALVEDAFGDMWLVTVDRIFARGRMRPVQGGLGEPVLMPLDFLPYDAAGADGVVYVSGTLGRREHVILAGTPGADLAAWPARAASVPPQRMALFQSAPGSGVVYTLNALGEIFRADEHGWTPLVDLDERGSKGDLAVLAEDDLLVITPDERRLVHVVGTSSVVESTDLEAKLATVEEKLETISVIPGYAAFASGRSGTLIQRTGARWQTAATNVLVNSAISVMVPFDDGMLLGGRYGIVDQRYPDMGYCVPERLFVGTNAYVEVAAQQGDRVAIAGYEVLSDDERRFFVQWLVPGAGARD